MHNVCITVTLSMLLCPQVPRFSFLSVLELEQTNEWMFSAMHNAAS